MPTGQILIKLIVAKKLIKVTGGVKPTFAVNLAGLRALLAIEQATLPPTQRMRRDTGQMSLPVPNGNPIVVPTIIMIGGNGCFGGSTGPSDGESVILDGRSKDGHILIVAGGNGEQNAGFAPGRSNGGTATVIGGNECLLIALGGAGGMGIVAQAAGMEGGAGGDAIAIAIGAGCDIYSQGGDGGAGTTGFAGSPGVAGDTMVPMVPGGPGMTGALGGDGGKAVASGGEASYATALGGNGGAAGPGGPGGPAAPAVFVGTPAPAGVAGRMGTGGRGANVTVTLGPNSVPGPATPGAGGPALGGTPGAPGVVEP
jgi:hypothetical protein